MYVHTHTAFQRHKRALSEKNQPTVSPGHLDLTTAHGGIYPHCIPNDTVPGSLQIRALAFFSFGQWQEWENLFSFSSPHHLRQRETCRRQNRHCLVKVEFFFSKAHKYFISCLPLCPNTLGWTEKWMTVYMARAHLASRQKGRKRGGDQRHQAPAARGSMKPGLRERKWLPVTRSFCVALSGRACAPAQGLAGSR